MDKKLRYINNHGIGQRLRDERERLGFTREQLAEKVDLAPLYIGQLERGERQMSMDTLFRMIEALNISTEYLLYGNKGNQLEKDRIVNLLNKCNTKELTLLENVIRSVLEYTLYE